MVTPDEPTADRTLAWLEAFAKAELTVTEFVGASGGFLQRATWEDTAVVREPRPVRDRIRRRFLVRMFAWDIRKGLRGALGNLKESDECERISVHVVLPGVTPARGNHWTRYVGDGVNIETADALGDNGEPWHALCVNGTFSLIHTPPATWDRDAVLAVDPHRHLPRELTEAEAIARVVRAYAAAARSFAANSLSSRLRKRLANSSEIPTRVIDACTSWLLWHQDDLARARSTLDMDSNQE